MSNVTVLFARRSIRARIGRLIAIAVAIVIGVSFVVGSFVLADSLRGGFDSLFTDINSHTDLEVRTKLAFGDTNDGSTRDPIPASLLDTVQAVAGRGHASTPGIQRQAVIIGPDGEAVGSGGAPDVRHLVGRRHVRQPDRDPRRQGPERRRPRR